MDKNPMISVIMSEYNTDAQLLKESIESILSQTYQNFELILIDDCGKNDVQSIVNSFNDDRIKLYKNDTNMGLVYSLNRAISLSHGEYIARMDTDDFAYPNRLEIQINYMIAHPEYDVIGSRCDYYDGKEIWGESKVYGDINRETMLRYCPLIHPSVMMKKKCIESIGGYFNYKRCEDVATWINIFINGYKMTVINDKLIRYHLSLDDYKKRTLKTRKDYYKFLKYEYIKLNPSIKDLIRVYLKSFVVVMIPGKIMYLYHRKKLKKGG